MNAPADRPPPHDADAERAALGVMLLDPEAARIVTELLTPGDFYEPRHGRLFAAFLEILRAVPELDLVTACAELERQGLLATCGGRDYLGKLIEARPSVANVEGYCGIVKRKAKDRGLVWAARAVADALAAGRDASEALAALHHEVAGTTSAAPGGPVLVLAGDLLRGYPTRRPVVIEGLLRRGETLNFISASKAGKSWTRDALALAVATGGEWFGFRCVPGRVLVLDNELHPEEAAHRLRTLAKELHIPPESFAERITYWLLRGDLKDVHAIEKDLHGLGAGSFALTILDALYRTLPKGTDENSNADMAGVYNVLDKLALRLDAGLLTVHHSTKGTQAGKYVLDVGAGAGAIARATDAHIVLREHEEDGAVVLEGKPRSFPPIAASCWRWQFPTWQAAPDLDPTSLRQPRRQKKTKEPAEPQAPAWTAERFLTTFISEKPVSPAAILARSEAEGLGLTARKIKVYLTALAEGGRVHLLREPQTAWRYATVPQPTLHDTPPRTHPPHPPRAEVHAGRGMCAREGTKPARKETAHV